MTMRIGTLFRRRPVRLASGQRRDPGRHRPLAIEPLESRRLLSAVTLTPTKDNTLFQSSAGSVSDGAGNGMAVGLNHFDGTLMRGVMAFNVAGSVPAGATVNSVTLSMWVNTTFSNSTPSVELHKLTSDWGEGASAPSSFMPPYGAVQTGDATWLHTFYPSGHWTTAGGDFSPTVSAAKTVSAANASYTWASTTQLVTDVQGWLNSPATNFGWLLKGDETKESGKLFDTRESPAAAHRPTLTINYTAAAPAPNMSIAGVALAEGNSGTTNFVFPVTLSAAATGTVTVQYATSNGTAAAGKDYTAESGTLTFSAGSTSQSITVPVSGNTLFETDKTFTVTLSGASGATLTTATATGTIQNDDVQPSLSVANVTQPKGASGTSNFAFPVTLSAASGVTATVAYATANGTALAGSDYQATSGTLTFPPGTTTQTINVPVIGGTAAGPDKTFTVSLSSPANATISTPQATGTIVNNNSAPTLSIGDVSVSEGNSGTTNAAFTVTLSAASGNTITVNYATADGTALAPGDYQSQSGTLTFTPGTTTQTVSVPVVGDTQTEPDETFLINLSAAANATIADAQATGTITNDDSQATLSIGNVALIEGDSGTSNAVFTVTLSAAGTGAVTVHYATADGTALAAGDYQSASGTLTFTPGTTTQTLAVPVVGDTTVEPDERFVVNLANATGATIGAGQGVGTIVTDDTTSLDLDVNGHADGLTDGLLVLRYLFQFTGPALTAGATAADATRTDPAAIKAYLDRFHASMLDVDGNGTADGLTDGILVMRYLFTFSGSALVSGVLGPGATRTDPAAITSYLNGLLPAARPAATAARPAAATADAASLHDAAIAAYYAQPADVAAPALTTAGSKILLAVI